MPPTKLDSQQVEILGRNRLVSELVLAGVEVAMPIRDRGIDLIAYLDQYDGRYSSRPIQMKAASDSSWGIERKYANFPELLLVYVWNLKSLEAAETYALTYPEALTIAEKLNWTRSPSWQKKGRYTTSQVTKELRGLLVPYRMTPETWVKKLRQFGDVRMVLSTAKQFDHRIRRCLIEYARGERSIGARICTVAHDILALTYKEGINEALLQSFDRVYAEIKADNTTPKDRHSLAVLLKEIYGALIHHPNSVTAWPQLQARWKNEIFRTIMKLLAQDDSRVTNSGFEP